MTIEDIKITIKNHILNSISHHDLTALCNTFEIPITGRRIHIQRRLIDRILVTNNVDLLHRILLMLNRTISHSNNANQMISSHTREAVHSYIHNGNLNMNSLNEIDRNNYAYNGIKVLNSKLYCISNETIEKCPIDLRREIVHGIDSMNLFIPNYTKYPNGYFNAPGASPTMLNGRVNVQNVQLPYCIKNAVVSSSQFYCCQVVLHPLSLLIPKPTPNICQPTRVMSKMPLQFTLSSHARNLISYHRTELNNRTIYKWQVLIRFGMYDPSKPFPPASSESISNLQEYIPPYLTLYVNNVAVPLWDILPSNSTAKEGKRHPRPINISDYLKFNNINDNLGNNMFANDPAGYRQSITVNWWQTPGVYQYYYFGVFLERKLAVSELIDRFVNRTHHIQMPISFTLDFIKEKFSSSSNRYTKEEDDDLVISSVLPISLLCPVGKSRITCPLRGIHCQHLQCFDAHLYLMMNERRSVWKCPVCDSQATLNELFVDEYFLKIIQQFSSEDELTEVNVNPDGSFVAVAVKESREHKQHIGNIISNVHTTNNNNNNIGDEKHSSNNSTGDSSSTESNNPVILLESDEEEQEIDNKLSPKKPDLEPTISSLLDSNPSLETEFVLKPPQSKPITLPLTIDLTSDSDDDREINILNTFSKSDISPSLRPAFHNQPHLPHPHHQNIQQNSQVIQHHLSHPTIAPKVSANNYVKLLESNVGYLNPSLNYHQSTSPSVSSQFQSAVSSSSSSQSLSKVPPFIWLSPNPRFPPNCSNKHLVNCFMPQLKQCYPNQNFVNMPQSISTNFQVPTSNCVKVPLIPRPIKIDPHLNLSHPFERDSLTANIATTSVHNSVLQRKGKPVHKIRPKKSSSLSNSYARRSTRIRNQNKKVYKERSSSGDDMNSSDSNDGEDNNDAYDEDDNDEDEEDDEDEDDDDDFSKVVVSLRNKRRNALDDSTSSNSSQSNRKRKRLVPDHLFEEECNNKERHVPNRLLGLQADIAANLKSPIVMLNKLDPLLIKVYLQQNEMSTQNSDCTLMKLDDSTGLSISKASSRVADSEIHEKSNSVITPLNKYNSSFSIQNN